MGTTAGSANGWGGPGGQMLGAQGRDKILEVVAKVFARRGYHGTDMEVLAEALQGGKGTLDRYGRGKEDLFLAAVDLGMRRLRMAVGAGGAEAQEPLGRIARALHACLTFFHAHPEFAELLIQQRAEFRDSWQTTWLAYREAVLGPWRPLYRGLAGPGRGRPMPAERSLDVVSEVVCGAALTSCLAGRGACLESRVQDVLDIVFDGILGDAGRAKWGRPGPPAAPATEAGQGSSPGQGEGKPTW